MKRSFNSHRRFLVSGTFLFSDFSVLIAATLVSIHVRFPESEQGFQFSTLNIQVPYAFALFIFSLSWIVMAFFSEGYRALSFSRTFIRDRTLFRESLSFFFTIGFLFYVFRVPFSRELFVFFSVFSVNAIFIFRFTLNKFLIQSFTRQGNLNQKLIVLSNSKASAKNYADWIQQNSELGLEVAGIYLIQNEFEKFGDDFAHSLVKNRIHGILIVSSTGSQLDIVKLVDLLSAFDVEIHVVSSILEKSEFYNFLVKPEYSPFFTVLRSRLPRPHQAAKKVFDFLFAFSFILFISPIFILISFLILILDGGPILYRSKRVGLDGQEFDFLKFRTMINDADKMKEKISNKHDSNHVLFKNDNDPRVTKLGRILRRYSLDELPQFFNVLKGDMSVVGPRPALREEVDRYTLLGSRRLHVKPGITGPWQVSGRADLSWSKSIMLDLDYAPKWSFWGDIWIIFRTVGVMITGKGAY